MIYVGIDIAKETHVAAAMNADGVILIEPFAFQNNHEGFKLLKSKLDTCPASATTTDDILCWSEDSTPTTASARSKVSLINV